jgi:hypothetical protein
MGEIYISSYCEHCKDLLIGIQKYEFISNKFNIINIDNGQYPDFIQTVPSMVLNGQLLTGQAIFRYFSEVVDAYLQQQSQTQEHVSEKREDILGTSEPKKVSINGEEIIDYEGWCSDGECLGYSTITEDNDDFTKGMHSFSNSVSFLDSSDSGDLPQQPNRVPLSKDEQYKKSDKQKEFDSDYERMMASRNSLK